ncbi:hypothetical protein BGY98DRAFT_153325 [Russula aff. rugulosa BPL654]|nr:hypothetical protein BGY98DRAFT_153325 [Russula aff. rugulosa BPL654]
MLMWLMTEATGVERSVEGFARRLLLANFASVHMTSSTVTQVLYRLLRHPEYLEPSAKRSMLLSEKRAGQKPGWIRCTR